MKHYFVIYNKKNAGSSSTTDQCEDDSTAYVVKSMKKCLILLFQHNKGIF